MTTPPSPPYRGPLRWMEGAPSITELAGMGVLALGIGIMFIVAKRLLVRYARSQWEGLPEPGSATLLWAGSSAATGGGLLWWLWARLEHIAARMGVTAVVLLFLLISEGRPSRRRGRR